MPLTRTLQEVVFAVHFVEPAPLRVTDVADWIREYGGERPIFQELAVLPPAHLPAPGINQPAQMMGIHMVGPFGMGIAMPRVRISGKEKHAVCVMQGDRIAFGWQRDVAIGEDVNYPGFDVLREEWAEEVTSFFDWVSNRLSHRLLPRLVELAYNNAYPIELDGRRRRMSEIFRLLDPDYRPVNGLNISWTELIGQPGAGVVNAIAGLGHVPPGTQVFGINYVGLVSVETRQPDAPYIDAIMDSLDRLHGRIFQMHKAAARE